MHTARAAEYPRAPSTFETQQQSAALKRISRFITTNMSNIRRLSRLPAQYDFNDVMAAYGKQAVAMPVPSPSIINNSNDGAPSPGSNANFQDPLARDITSPLIAPQALRGNIRTPSLERHAQLTYRLPPQQTLPTHSPLAHSQPPSMFLSLTNSPTASMNAAIVRLTRRQPPRSSTPLPASPRASLALSANTARRKISGDVPPVPNMTNMVASLNALKLAESVNGDELRFQ
jgi:hypothetical protein